MTNNSIYPYAPIHPGEILREETMPGHNWTVETLAESLNVEKSRVSDLVNGRNPVDQDMSQRLGKLMGISPKFWFRVQQSYEMEIVECDLKIQMKAAGTPMDFDELNKQKTILSALSATKQYAKVGSVQAQKIIFKIEKEVDKSDIWIPKFSFVPYKHGPFDHELNSVLNRLVEEGFIDITFPPSTQEWKKRKYVLNDKGREIGLKLLKIMPEEVKSKIFEIVEWVMKLSVRRLKAEIFGQYPEYNPDFE